MTKHPVSAAPFKRPPRPWYKRATAAFHAPQGGIPVAGVIPRQVDCGSFILRFLEPSAAFGEGMGTPDSDRVSLDTNAFKESNLSDSRTYHPMIKLGLSNWIYHLPRWHSSRFYPVPHPPYAVITAHWQLERVKHDIQLKPDDTTLLEDYLRHDYTAYLESEGGPNWKVRDEAFNGKTITGDPLPQYQIDHIIENGLLAPPLSYEVLTCNAMHWLRYLWAPRPAMPEALNYTTTLLPDVLLTVDFHIVRMNSEPWEDWWNLFLEDCEILVKSIACQRKALPDAD
ncbi:hypothetical protein [Rhodanobacter ginsengiterrae]|uniref:hypothetical protein n=1 Tax=Rhodanobacter ginsengiterrae TaxID=2008451 RepID=UPI003CECB3DE